MHRNKPVLRRVLLVAAAGRRGALDARTAPGIADERIDDEQSATLETAALFVRGAVRSVLFERTGARDPTGDLSMAIQSPPAVLPEGAAAPASQAPPVRALEDAVDQNLSQGQVGSTPLAWAPRVGVDWSYAGLSRSGSWSIDAGLALRLGRFSAGVAGSLGFPEIVQHQNVELSLRRQALLAEVGWELLRLPRFSLGPTLQAGAAGFSRSSRTSTLDRAATPDRVSVSALVVLEWVAEYELTGALRLRASTGLDWLSHVPRYSLDVPLAVPGAPLEAWRWQPNAGIALGAVF